VIVEAIRAKIREQGVANTAWDAAATLSGCLFLGAVYGTLALVLVGVALPVVAFELLMEAAPRECRCVNSFDEFRCGRGAR
jgi:hypothetical protein